MFDEKWPTMLFISFLAVVIVNSVLASCTSIYYQKKSTGLLSHSQLRIKQGSATPEHRLNVFGQAMVFSFISLRVYICTLIVWLTGSGILYYFY